MLASTKDSVLSLYTNLRGWRTRRKLVIFESDDWGAIRMPGRRAFDALLEAGIRVDKSRYDRLDCLEDRGDLEALMSVLESRRDVAGRPAAFTFNTVMGNPDFEAIQQDRFERFTHQHMFDSYRQYHGQDLEPVWREAMEMRLIHPQFHAREHLNTTLWMRDLQAGHREARLAFEQHFYGLKTRTGSANQGNYLAAYWPDDKQALDEVCRIVVDGADRFEKAFGFRSKTFIGCNYVWPEALEEHLAKLGVEQLQTQRGHIQPDPKRGGAASIKRRYTGQRNRYGQHYSVRNVLFEPYLDQSTDWAGRAMAEIGQAFRLYRPAIVCSHRINYVSGMDIVHRDGSLRQLDKLLVQILRRWPEVEFITSEELSRLMKRGGDERVLQARRKTS